MPETHKCEDFLHLFVIYECKFRVVVFWAVGPKKTFKDITLDCLDFCFTFLFCASPNPIQLFRRLF